MRVSVVTPVYNAADYVRQAVESALAQPETGEVILVEDGSQDNSLVACQELADTYPKVRLYRHADGQNHGVAASRNLGLGKSKCEYVAFLDADDFYLPGRFAVANELLEGNPELDGVYEAFGECVESEAAAQSWDSVGRPRGGLTTMTIRVPPEQLFGVLVKGEHGYFHICCLVVRRDAFERTGPFDVSLDPADDTAMIWKMAAVAKLAPGRLDEPVAMRRIHECNMMSTPHLRSFRQAYERWMRLLCTTWRWCRENVGREKREVILHRFLNYAEYSRLNEEWPVWTLRFQRRFWLILLLLRNPVLVSEPSYWERLIPDRVHIICHCLAEDSGHCSDPGSGGCG